MHPTQFSCGCIKSHDIPPRSGRRVNNAVDHQRSILQVVRNINLPDPGPGAIDPRRRYYNLYQGVTGISWLESSGNSFFSSLQASFEKRFSGGFYMLANWTWSHALDNVGGDGGRTGRSRRIRETAGPTGPAPTATCATV